MIEGGIGGGNTKTGLKFEKRVNILTLLKRKKGYRVHGNTIFYNGRMLFINISSLKKFITRNIFRRNFFPMKLFT